MIIFKGLYFLITILLIKKTFSADCYDKNLCNEVECEDKIYMMEYFQKLKKCGPGSCLGVVSKNLNGHLCWVKGNDYNKYDEGYMDILNKCVKNNKEDTMYSQGYWIDSNNKLCYDFKKTGNCIFEEFKECDVIYR